MTVEAPPIVPAITTPVAQRTDPENFSVLHDRFLREMPPAVDGINSVAGWTHQTALAAAQDASTAAAKAAIASNEADRALSEANKSSASADTAEAAALVAQNAAGIPADFSGMAGMPLSVNPNENGTHFADPIFPFKVVTANYTAKAGDIIAADVRTKNITITLPADPIHRAKVTIFSYARAESDYVLTVARNGKQLMRLNESMEIDAPYATAKLVYDQTIGWILYE